MLSTSALLVAIAGLAAAQRPTNTSICDYYTTALFKDNTSDNQLKLVTAVVNRAVVGNTTFKAEFTGIVGAGTFNGASVMLAPYFSGALNSTNRGGTSGVSVNFLDGGGATPLMNGMAANGTSGNQYELFTHLYEYFGAALGCSTYGMGYPAYAGEASMYEVHKFMGLDTNEVGYFVEQVGLSAASFGVTMDDVTAVGTLLNKLFNNRCGPKVTVIPAQGAQQQSICTDMSCPIAANGTCSDYMTEPMPTNVTMNGTSSSSSMMPSGTSSGGMGGGMGGGSSSSSSAPATQTTNAASNLVAGGLMAAAAFAFAL